MLKKLLEAATIGICAVALAGCGGAGEPFKAQLTEIPLLNSGFSLLAKPAESCGSAIFGCTQPLFEYVYGADSSLDAAKACDALIDTAQMIGKPTGYGPEGQQAGPFPPADSTARAFCTESLGTERESIDKSFKYYEGFLVVDDGSSDSIGKNLMLRRDGDGKYQAIIAFSRDLPRISWPVSSEPPKHSYGD